MKTFINEYKSKIQGYTPSSAHKLHPGNIIRFSYPSETNKFPHVFVLNEFYQSKLHGLVLDYINPNIFNKFIQYILNSVLSEVKSVDKISNYRVEDLMQSLIGTSQSPITFYNIRLKPFMSKYLSNINCYRQYDIVKMNNVQLVNYMFLL